MWCSVSLHGTWTGRTTPLSSLHLHLGQGESKTWWGCVVPRWVLLINVRNGTEGYKALNRSVISYMGFAECLDTDNEEETCGPASVAALPYGSRTPPGMLRAAVQARGSFCAWHRAVSGCIQWPGSCSRPRGDNSADSSLLLAAAYSIFMHPSARQYPSASCAPGSRALLRYRAVTGAAWSPAWGWEQAPQLLPGSLLVAARHRGWDALGGHWHWISLCHLSLQAPQISDCQEVGVQNMPDESRLQKRLVWSTEQPVAQWWVSIVRAGQLVTCTPWYLCALGTVSPRQSISYAASGLHGHLLGRG